MGEKIYTISQAAKLQELGYGKSHIRKLIDKKELRAIDFRTEEQKKKSPRKLIRIEESAIREFVEKRKG